MRSLHLQMIVLIVEKTFFLCFENCATPAGYINNKRIREKYNERRYVLYRIEITLYDSFKLLTPVGVQDSYFGRLYTVQYIQA